MRYTDQHTQYALLDTDSGERLENWNGILLIRPDPQVIWKTGKNHPLWKQAHARYHRSDKGGGRWENYRAVPEVWQMQYRDLTFNLKPMGFKHTGLFPEQAVNWDWMQDKIRRTPKTDKPFSVLNLFAYTGGATLACLAAGAEVTHVDASKGMVAWARENAAASDLSGAKCRWLVDDCLKFVQRELRRGTRYDGILMDPPSYGRGPGGEVWKLEDTIYELIALCAQLLSDDASFFIVNSYTTGLAPSVMGYMLETVIRSQRGGSVSADEIGLPVQSNGLVLPCGATAVWEGQDR